MLFFKLKHNSFAILTKEVMHGKACPVMTVHTLVGIPSLFTVLAGEFIVLNVVNTILMLKSLYSLVVENVTGHLEIFSV